MTCEKVPTPEGYAIVCGRGRTTQICDVCDKRVRKGANEFEWRGVKVDICPTCKTGYDGDPVFREWADGVIAKHYPEAV